MVLKVLPVLKSQSREFLDFLISKQALKSGFKAILSGRDFPEIDEYILSHRLVSQEQLARYYAEFYNLPFLRLVDKPIKPSVISLLPEDIARRYRVVPYELTGMNLYLAIGEPSRLQQNAPSVLVSLRRQKGLMIHLAITAKADVDALLNKLHAPVVTHPPKPKINPPVQPPAPIPVKPPQTVITPPPPMPSPKPNPPAPAPVTPPPTVVKSLNKEDLIKEVEPREKEIDLKGLTIDKALLEKVPLDVAKRYQMIVFGQESSKSNFEPPLIKIALVHPDDPHAREILSYIEGKNKVLVDRYRTTPASFEEALKQYPAPNPAEKKTEAKIETEAEVKPAGVAQMAPKDLATEPKEINEPIINLMPAGAANKVQKPEEKKTTPEPSLSPQIPAAVPDKVEEGAKTPVIQSSVTTKIPGASEGLVLNADDITSRPNVGESTQDLQKLAKEQENSLESQNLDRLLRAPVTSVDDLAKSFKSGVVPEIVAAMLFLAIRMKASDVHLEALENAVRVRYRIDGILHDILSVPHFLHAPLISRIKILAKMKIDEQRIPQDGRFDVVIDNRQVDLRVSTLPTVHGEKIVMRLLDKSGGVLTLEQLGVTGSNFDTLIANISKPYGIILATGPTGSGKSTTLYAVLSRLSKPGVNIITLEDPVEYELAGVNQAQVKPQIGFTFAEGLRSVLRQDPNIIMVGEIRDLETAAMATHAALTGHLVLSTLHTNDASGALPRLINIGVEPFLITSSINAVVGQRLVRKICDKCRVRTNIPPALLEQIKKQLSALPSGQMKNIDMNQLIFYHGQGCQFCNNGYAGRIGIYEVLAMTEKIEELAVRKAPASELKKAAIGQGMITMLQDGLIKALKGITTVDEIMRVTTTHTSEVPGLE